LGKSLLKRSQINPLSMKLWFKICALCAAICLGASLNGGAQTRESDQRPSRASRKAAQRPLKNVTYSFVAGKKLKLDLYYPAQLSQGPFPVIIYLHAGAWMGGSKGGKEIKTYLPYMLERGYAVASIQYRLAPKSKFPAQVEDSKCAVRFLRKNGPSFMLDPARIGVLGASAGGHLAFLEQAQAAI
jgi:acetyl esterase/lipase